MKINKMLFHKRVLIFLFFIGYSAVALSQNGYGLWLDYKKVSDASLLGDYQNQIQSVYFPGESSTLDVARAELKLGLNALLGTTMEFSSSASNNTQLIVAKFEQLDQKLQKNLKKVKIPEDGYYIGHVAGNTVITAKEDVGLLYGVFNFLRMLQTQQPI